MNKRRRSCWPLFVLASASLGTASLVAQDVPPPKAPFVVNLPESARWTLTSSDPPGKKPVADPSKQQSGDAWVRSVESEKHGNVRHEVISWSNGNSTEGWTVGEYYAADTREGNFVNVQSVAMNSGERGVKIDFPLISWIGQQNYKGVEAIDGRKCYAYRDQLAVMQSTGGHLLHVQAASSQMSAFISVDTGLPVLAQVGGVNVNFKFEPGAVGPLTVPDKYLQAIARVDDVMKAARRRPPAP